MMELWTDGASEVLYHPELSPGVVGRPDVQIRTPTTLNSEDVTRDTDGTL